MATLLLSLTFKATAILIAAWLLTRIMARGSASSRHLVWTLAMVALLALPLMQFAPAWELPVLPMGSDPINDSTQPLDTAYVMGSDPITESAQRVDTPRVMGSDPIDEATQPFDMTRVWGLTPYVWLAGMLFAVARLVAGLLWVRRVTRRAQAIADPEWIAALDETTAALRVRSTVALKVSADTKIPVACGIWSPTVLLPMDALQWTEERRRVVLLHELSHVARRDCLVQALAQLGRAVHWFNPLAHVALARLRAEQEHACDDLVLAAGTDAPSYADHLFEIARTFRAGSCPAWATLAMARPSQLEGRVLAILDDRLNRRVPARWVRAAVGVAAAALTLPIGVLQLTAAAEIDPQAPRRMMSAGERVAASAALDVATAEQTPASAAPAAPAQWTEKTLVHGAADIIGMLDNLDFDFDFDKDIDIDPPDVDVDPKPNPNPHPNFSQSSSQSSSSSSSQSQTQNNQAPRQDNTVSDDTRRRVADALMTALNDENPEVREQALNALANMRDPRAVPGLVRALRDSNVDVREQAVNALAQFDTPEAIDGVMSALKDSSEDVREHAARHMAALVARGRATDPKYVDAVTALLKDSSPDVREMAIMAVGRMRRAESVPMLLPLLKDASADVREQAAMALGSIADPRAIDALTAALKDASPDVREQAAIALGRIARGERRGFGPKPPVPPVPPKVPAVRLDARKLQEMAARAQEEALRQLEEAQEELARQLR